MVCNIIPELKTLVDAKMVACTRSGLLAQANMSRKMTLLEGNSGWLFFSKGCDGSFAHLKHTILL